MVYRPGFLYVIWVPRVFPSHILLSLAFNCGELFLQVPSRFPTSSPFCLPQAPAWSDLLRTPLFGRCSFMREHFRQTPAFVRPTSENNSAPVRPPDLTSSPGHMVFFQLIFNCLLSFFSGVEIVTVTGLTSRKMTTHGRKSCSSRIVLAVPMWWLTYRLL